MSIIACSVDGCEKPKFAVKMCQMHYHRTRRHGSLSAEHSGTCKACGQGFTYEKKSGQVPLFCSDACRKPKPRIFPDACVVCGGEAGNFKPYRRYCSAKCQTEAVRFPHGRPVRDCIECGCPLDFTQKRPGGRTIKSDTRKCFDCRRNQVPELNARQLAERDGPNCSICTEPVDFSLKWPNRFSPSIDHVYPYSLGGGNEASNLALAHLTCNISKKNKVA